MEIIAIYTDFYSDSISFILFVLSLLAFIYVQVLWPQLQLRAYFNTPLDLVIGVVLIVLALEATRRSLGFILPIVAIIMIVYPFIGSHLPEPFHTQILGIPQYIANLSIGLEKGVYQYLNMSSDYIFLFVIFGSILQAMKATDVFMDIGKLIGGKLRGGPAFMAIISSCLVGSIIGSAAANVAITGSFSIPLMKRLGFKPAQAASIEAAASNGGQIMPPIMGMVAFGMAAFTGIPYIKIAAMALIPAIIYYFCLFIYVYLWAKKSGMEAMTGEKVNIKELLLSLPTIIIPFTVIIILLMAGKTVMYVAFWAILSSVVIGLIRKKTRPSLSAFIGAITEGAITGAGIGVSVTCAGLFAAVFSMSGLGVKLASGIEVWSGGFLFLGLIIVWFICILMGLIGIALTAYILVALFAVPIMVNLGVSWEVSHFFVMFISVFAFITPPVGPVSLIAAKLAEADYIETAIESCKVAIAGFLLPFAFIYCPILLLHPQDIHLEIFEIFALIVSLFVLQIAFVGYYINKCSFTEKILSLASGVVLFAFLPLQNFVLLGVGIVLFILVTFLQLKKRLSPNLSAKS
jgi:TRAP transporter 4TM/12TM fusion protein